MKHTLKITIVILAMFLLTQFIGLYVINHYSVQGNPLPYGMDNQVEESTGLSYLPSIVIAFIFAILIFIILTKFNFSFVMRIWFFIVIMLALGITITSFLPNEKYVSLFALIIALPFALSRVVKRNILVHNVTELFIYPGIAAVFVPFLNIITILVLLALISVYDMWAVWHSGIMQKMAKYQINTVKVFGGFFVPYLSKKEKKKIKAMRNLPKSKLENMKDEKIKAQVAILGGGDIVFPLITAGVLLKVWGLIPAIITIAGALLGLSYLLFIAKKKKFYPAMPFITAGIYLGILISWLVFVM